MVRPAENMPLTKWHGSEGKFCYKMIPFVTKMSPQRGHGSTHSIAEIGTGIGQTFDWEKLSRIMMFDSALKLGLPSVEAPTQQIPPKIGETEQTEMF